MILSFRPFTLALAYFCLFFSSCHAFLAPTSDSIVAKKVANIGTVASSSISHVLASPLYSSSSNVEDNNIAATSTTNTNADTETDATSQSKPIFNLKGYTKVYDDANALQEGEQFPLVLQSTQDKSYLRDRFFILLKNEGKVHLIDPQCGRCNFPLINGEIVEEPALNLSDNTSITCKLCGLRHSIIDGSISKPKSGGTNFIQKVGGVFFNKGERSDILVHPVHVTEKGEIYAKILPRKKITEVMPFQD